MDFLSSQLRCQLDLILVSVNVAWRASVSGGTKSALNSYLLLTGFWETEVSMLSQVKWPHGVAEKQIKKMRKT